MDEYEDDQVDNKLYSQNTQSQSQTQPDVNKLLSDIFGDSDEEADAPLQSKNLVSKLDDDDDIFGSDEEDEKPTNIEKAVISKDDDDIFGDDSSDDGTSDKKSSIKVDDDDIFGSDESDDEQPKKTSPKKLSRLHKGKAEKPAKVQDDTKKSKKNKSSDDKKVSKNKVEENESSSIPGSSKKLQSSSKKNKDTSENLSDADSYDSGDDLVRTAEDDQFIDAEDDNADLLDEYAQDNEDFDDERPDKPSKGEKRRRDDDRAGGRGDGLSRAEEQENNPLAETLRHMKKRRNEDLSEAHKAELAQDLLQRMDRAASEDVAGVAEGRPALAKLALLKKVLRLAGVKSLQMTLLDHDFLTALKNWIEPRDRRTLPGLTVRSAVYSILQSLPCQADHLRSSGIGKVLVALAKHPMETADNRRVIKNVIDKWCRPIFGKSSDIRSVEQNSSLDEERRAALAMLKTVTAPAVRPTFSGLGVGAGPPPSQDPQSRVRVPKGTNLGFSFAVRPESAVDRTAVREQGVKGSKGLLLKRMKDGGGRGRMDFHAERVVLSGRDKP